MRQRTRENDFNVMFPDYPSLEIMPYKLEIIQFMGNHDIVKLHFADTVPLLLEGIATGAPVIVKWANDKVSGTFFGYKADGAFKSSIVRKRRTVLTCIGASYPLKENANKIWRNKTAPEIVTEIANFFNLKPVVTPHPIRWGQQSMVGQSYWEKVRELADRVGYAVQMQGSELHFHPIDKMIDRFLTSMPVMALLDSGAGFDTTYEGRTLEYFEPTIGDYNETVKHKRTEKTIKGVDPLTGKIYGSKASPNIVGKKIKNKTKDPLFSQFETSTVTGSKAMAESISNAKADMSRFSITAIGYGQGDPRVSPWRTIDIRQSEDSASGLWVVKSATHTLTRNYRYYVEFECVTDGTGEQTSGSRVSRGSQAATVNLADALEFGTTGANASTTLNSQSLIINEANTGYKVTPRRWEAS